MKAKIIRCELTEKSIDNAIKEVYRYKLHLSEKLMELQDRVGDKLAQLAQQGFNHGTAEETTDGGSIPANVTLSVSKDGDTTIVYAEGDDAVWCEFGAGVYYNGSVGSSPHPKGAELGFAIGTYGQGKGARKAWCFYKDGELHWTHGVPASMPMYKACESVIDDIANIAREVFASD